MDVDEERLRVSELVTRRIVEALGANTSVEATLDRRAALDGADYVITMMQVGGYRPATVTDFELPKRFGLGQTIGDTVGIGAIMRGLRTIPVLLEVCRDMEELCPDALLLQYVNPMAMLCWAVARASPIRTVGLCHSVQGTARELALDVGVPADELEYICAGITTSRSTSSCATTPTISIPSFGRRTTFRTGIASATRCYGTSGTSVRSRRSTSRNTSRGSSSERDRSSWIVRALETGEPFTFNANVMNDGPVEMRLSGRRDDTRGPHRPQEPCGQEPVGGHPAGPG